MEKEREKERDQERRTGTQRCLRTQRNPQITRTKKKLHGPKNINIALKHSSV
jgi:hypothetical protein